MNKVLEHLKNNLALYLVLVVVLIIIAILIFNPNTNKPKINYDTSLFEVITPSETIKLFEDKKTTILLIGKETCTASQEMIPYMQIAMAKYGFNVHYLELTDIEINSDEHKKIIELLDYEYTKNGETKTFGEYIGATPMFIIIKEGKMVFGYIGTMNSTVIGTIANQYGVAQYEQEN